LNISREGEATASLDNMYLCSVTLRGKKFFLIVLLSAAAGNKSATWPPLPPPGCRGEWKDTGRSWWVGIRAV